ncbi:ABC transporter permease [Marinifilum caeruleilacunae]|uniref:ABC transporter permease n=1 Tax=Marinifilum caeruleilacunae TaxID=2499076 RepID=A0ABX1WUZ7_9BACT|nr:ABC transporter permease [Marinifilum caeruleilacunae]NOU59919.1 ABC transporter permease [Marinifilum caeruleilacunae]
MLTIVKIAVAKLLHKPYNSALSVLLFAIGVALISLIIKTETLLNNQYKNNLAGIDLVVGAKGSPLQLILSSVLHIDAPTGNIPLEEVKRVQSNPLVKNTIPIALGDSHKGFRIVGTHTDYLQLYACEFQEGNSFSEPFEAVIGANVSKKTGLKIGDTFTGVHGFLEEGHSHEDFRYTVTGVLKRSGNVTDNLILSPVESVWMVHGHNKNGGEWEHKNCDCCEHEQHDHSEHGEEEHHHHENCEHDHHEHDETYTHEDQHEHEYEGNTHEIETLEQLQNKLSQGGELSEEEAKLYMELKGQLVVKTTEASEEITALLVFYKSPQAAISLPRAINQNTTMQAASPALELNRLISMLGMGLNTLRLLAWIIIVISAINIFIYLLNIFNQSIFELALLRLAGASKLKVVALLYAQGIFLAVSGWFIGMIVSYVIWMYLPQFELGRYFDIGVFFKELILLLFCVGIGLLVALIPAIKAYKNNLHFTLSR